MKVAAFLAAASTAMHNAWRLSAAPRASASETGQYRTDAQARSRDRPARSGDVKVSPRNYGANSVPLPGDGGSAGGGGGTAQQPLRQSCWARAGVRPSAPRTATANKTLAI